MVVFLQTPSECVFFSSLLLLVSKDKVTIIFEHTPFLFSLSFLSYMIPHPSGLTRTKATYHSDPASNSVKRFEKFPIYVLPS